jgi:hypothetical protein
MRVSVWLLAAVVLSAGCDIQVDEHGIRSVRVAEGRAQDVWSRTYTLAPNGMLEVVGENGSIYVRAGDGPEVEVRAEREAQASSDEAARGLLQKSRIQEDVTSTSVRLATVDAEEGGFGPSRVNIDYRVAVPAGLALTLKTQNGAVRVDLASIAGDVVLSTTNGGIRLTVPPRAKMNLEASVVNGRIQVDEDFSVVPGEGPMQRLRAPINGGGPKVSATTVNGGIRIRARQ